MAARVIDDTKLQNIAVAIQSKDNGGQMTVDQMAGRIEAIPTGIDMTVTDNQIKMLVYIHPEITHCFVNYVQSIANDVEVDWGDGTTIDTSDHIGLGRYDCAFVSHDYDSIGFKIITLTANEGTLKVISSNGFISFAGANGSVNGNQFPNNYYRDSVIGVSFGNNTDGSIEECKALVFVYNMMGNSAAYNSALTNITFHSEIAACPLLTSVCIRNIKIPSTIRNFKNNGFRGCSFLGVVDFTDFTIDGLSQCTFGSELFSGSTNNGLTILFKDQETAEYAKTITNLSTWSSYIKYVGEV